MEDPAVKIKQLSESLQQQQAKVSKKKEENEALNKSIPTLEKELQNLRMQFIILQGEQENKKSTLNRSKDELRKKIEYANRIISADKVVLEAQKSVLQPRLETLEAEVKKAQDNKSELIKSKKGDISSYEEKKIASLEESKKDTEKEETFESLVQSIKVNKDEATGVLTVETITGIVEACITLAGRKFSETVRENRRKLRANKNLDVKTYLEQSSNELNQHSEFFKELETKILNELGVDKGLMDKSIEYYISAGNFEVIALMNLLGERFKSFIKSSKKIDNETFKEILRFKNEFVEKEAKNIFGADNKRIIVQSHLATVSGTYAQKEEMSLGMLRNFFEFRLGSAIFEKFGVEEEDIREAASNPEVQYDMEIASLSFQGEEILFKQVPELAAAAAAAQQQGGHY